MNVQRCYKLIKPEENVYGAGGRHGELTATYDELIKLIGLPTIPEGDGEKTDAEWILTHGDEKITIYNYKTGKNYNGEAGTPTRDITEWNIGGTNEFTCKQFILDFYYLLKHTDESIR